MIIDRRMVVGIVHIHLHVALDVADLDAVAPFGNVDGQVVDPAVHRSIPHQVARHRVDIEGVTRFGKRVSFDGLAVLFATDGEGIGKTVPVGIIGGGVVDEDMPDSRLVIGRTEQHRRTVGPDGRVDHQHGLHRENDIDRVGDVLHPVVAVGVLHHDAVHPGTGIGMTGDVNILVIVVGQGDLGHPRHHRRGVVAPLHLQLRTVGHAQRVGEGGDRNLIGELAHLLAGDLARPVVRSQGRPSHSQEYQQRQPTLQNMYAP